MSKDRTDITFIGDRQVGKTALINRMLTTLELEAMFKDKRNLTFTDEYKPTISYEILPFEKENREYFFIDISSDERYETLYTSFARRTDLFVCVYDLTNRDSLLRLLDVYIKYNSNKKMPTPVYLIGTKWDLCSVTTKHLANPVSSEDYDKIVADFNQLGVTILDGFGKVSAKEETGVSTAFSDILTAGKTAKEIRIADVHKKKSLQAQYSKARHFESLRQRQVDFSVANILVVGWDVCGKTSLIKAFLEPGVELKERPHPLTYCFDQYATEHNQKKYHIYDTSGRREFTIDRALIACSSDACLFVYDQTDKKSLQALNGLAKSISHILVESKTPVIIVGTKCDFVDEAIKKNPQSIVTQEDIESLQEVLSEMGVSVNTTHWQVSSKTHHLVPELFEFAVKQADDYQVAANFKQLLENAATYSPVHLVLKFGAMKSKAPQDSTVHKFSDDQQPKP